MNATTQRNMPFGNAGIASLAATLAAATLILLASIYVLPWLNRWRRLRPIPTPPESNWLLGNLLPMLAPNHHLALRAWGKQLGGLYRLRLAWTQAVIIVDADHANTVLGAEEGLSKGIEPYQANKFICVEGHSMLFSAKTNSKEWRLVRKGTAPAFVSKNIRNGFPDTFKTMEHIVAHIAKAGPGVDIDINNILMRFAMDVTGLIGFAKDFRTCAAWNDEDTDELFNIVRGGALEVYLRGVNPLREHFKFLPAIWQGQQFFHRFKARMRALLLEVKARGEPAAEDVSIAAHLLRLRDPETGEPLSDDALVGEFGIFFAAGIETAGNAMAWTMFLISQHPEVDAKIAAEFDAAGQLASKDNPDPRPLTYADLSGLPYFTNEAMRLKPVAATGTTRIAARDLVLGEHTIPADTLLWVPFDAIHHSELNYEDAGKFKPERWDAPDAEFKPSADQGKKGAKRYLPFSTGPRQCIGMSLAKMMHNTGIAVLLTRYTFSLAPKMGGAEGVLANEINRLTLQPGSGLWMRATPRFPRE